jgi:PAS domain-containing protein
MPNPALVLDAELRVVSANDAAVDALAQGKLTLLGLPLDRLGWTELADPRLRSALERSLREGTPFRRLQLAGQRRAYGARLPPTGDGGAQLLLLLDGMEEEARP